MTDGEIIDLFFARNEKAVKETEKKYGKNLRKISFGIVNDEETGRECENDTYLKAWNTIPPNEPREHFYAYLVKIIRNISLNVCRNNGRLKRKAFICELSDEMEECIPCPDDTPCKIEENELKEQLNIFLEALSKEKRDIFLNRYFFLKSTREIAEKYNISESNVKTALFRLRKQLREQLEKEGYNI